MEQIRSRVNDDVFTSAMFEKLYTAQMNLICTWLTERMDRTLHVYQVNCLSKIIKVRECYCFAMDGEDAACPVLTPRFKSLRQAIRPALVLEHIKKQICL